jgi:hypothetical protein
LFSRLDDRTLSAMSESLPAGRPLETITFQARARRDMRGVLRPPALVAPAPSGLVTPLLTRPALFGS